MKFKPRPYQQEGIDKGAYFFNHTKGKSALIVAPTGCHAKGTEILMYDLSVKKVEDVRVGDILMGPDSSPREVLQLCRGVDEMFRITPKKGSPFVVNGGHILNLECTRERNDPKRTLSSTKLGGEVENISVNDYLSKSNNWKHLRKLHYSKEIQVQKSKDTLPIPAWHLGVILGDGSVGYGSVSICNNDPEIEVAANELAKIFSCYVRKEIKSKNAKTYHISKKSGKRNKLINALRSIDIMGKRAGEKEIPDQYIRTDKNTRAEVLAGLIDTDGYHDGKGGLDYVSKSKKMSEQVVFIAKSLGISARMTKCKKRCQNNFEGTYYRVSLSGNTHRIPCRVSRKIPAKRKINKNPLRTGFSIESIGSGDFYGFTLDKDHLYLTSDFIVHHNSGKSVYIANIADKLAGKVLVLQPQKEILEQNYQKFTAMGGHAGIFSASAGRKDVSRVTYATPGSVYNNLEKFTDIRQVIIDECHIQSSAKAGRLKNILSALPNPKVLGLTATPFRMYSVMGGSMLKMLTRTRPKMFNEMIHWTQIADLKNQGYLAHLKYYSLCKGFDRRKIKINTSGSDFDEESLKEYYRTIHFTLEIVDVVSRINKVGRSVLCFTNFVSDAQEVSEILNKKGYTSAVVHGKTPKKERERIIEEFRSGRIKSVVNVGTLTTGFDYPELDAVVIARPMRSLSLYYQMAGRAMRIHPDKEDAWVVDLCGNFEMFGRVEDLTIKFEKGQYNLPYIAGSGGKKLTGVLLSPDEDKVKKYKTENNGHFWI